MYVHIDCREHELWRLIERKIGQPRLQFLCGMKKEDTDRLLWKTTFRQEVLEIEFLKHALPMGDIWIELPNQKILVIERKQLSDFMTSFYTHRYQEQRSRLEEWSQQEGHDVLWLLELPTHYEYKHADEYSKIQQILVKQVWEKKTQVWTTWGTEGTCTFIFHLIPIFFLQQDGGERLDIENNLHQAIRPIRKRSDALSPRFLLIHLLQTIPGISIQMAETIVGECTCVSEFISNYNIDQTASQMYTSKSGSKPRKIGQAIANKIFHFLFVQ